jgi:outer membrane protein TolC
MRNLVFHHDVALRDHGGALCAQDTKHTKTKSLFACFVHAEGLRGLMVAAILLVAANSALAQTVERLTFQQAIDRAVKNNPTVAEATTGIMRAEAILQQVRSSSLPTLAASLATSIVNPVKFGAQSIVPLVQTQTTVGLAVPILTPVAWAQRNQAGDQVVVAQQNEKDVQRQVAVAAGQSYLAIIARRRVLDLNTRARDNAKAHFDFANQRLQGGLGSRLNALRAEQEFLSDDTRVEEALLLIQLAQEALGVLVGADGPVDAVDYPVFNIPDELGQVTNRSDIQLLLAREAAAQRVFSDSWKDRLPSLNAAFTPSLLEPPGLFAKAASWRAQVLFAVPLFDSGFRAGEKAQRLADLSSIKFQRTNAEREAASEIRAARDSVASTTRAFNAAQQATDRANQVVMITDVAFREGASTNIEVLDAQRQARDVETQAAIAEDALKRAQLDLLVALGRFPQ